MFGTGRPIHSNEQRAIYNNRKYFTLGGCLVLEGQYIQTSREQSTITEIFHFGRVFGTGRPIYLNERRAIYNNRKYFTLGGCLVLEGQYNQTRREQYAITEIISQCVQTTYRFREYIPWEGTWVGLVNRGA